MAKLSDEQLREALGDIERGLLDKYTYKSALRELLAWREIGQEQWTPFLNVCQSNIAEYERVAGGDPGELETARNARTRLTLLREAVSRLLERGVWRMEDADGKE